MTSRLLVDKIEGKATSGTITVPNHVINVTHLKNDTRTALSGAASSALWSGDNVTKLISSSKLIITGLMVFRDGASYFMGAYWKIGSSGNRYDGVVQHGYAADAGDASVQFGWQINAEYDATETGTLAVEIGWNTANSAGSNNPGATWNPNSSDDARSHQKASTLTIFEVAK
tara:strand:+ start:60 stop:575 length:516 start_codon:yes stop_codon:yes gene_type:complete